MINFKPENLNQLLKLMLISANKSYDAIKNYEFTGEAVVFRVDFEYIDVSLMIVDMLGDQLLNLTFCHMPVRIRMK